MGKIKRQSIVDRYIYEIKKYFKSLNSPLNSCVGFMGDDKKAVYILLKKMRKLKMKPFSLSCKENIWFTDNFKKTKKNNPNLINISWEEVFYIIKTNNIEKLRNP